MDADIFEKFRNGRTGRSDILELLDPFSSWGDRTLNRFYDITDKQFVALPWLIGRDNVRLLASPHHFETTQEARGEVGLYLALELGPGLFCGRSALEAGYRFDKEVERILPRCRRLVTTEPLHITLAYLPNLAWDQYKHIEDKIGNLIDGWKRDIEASDFRPCPFRDLPLKMVDMRTDPKPADGWMRKALIQKPVGKGLTSWTMEEGLAWTHRAFEEEEYCMRLHPQLGQSDAEYVTATFRRDWERKERYENIREGYANFIAPVLARTLDKRLINVAYFHATDPENAAEDNSSFVDTRLNKFGSSLILHLLHNIREVLSSATSYLLKQDPDRKYRILTDQNWHASPTKQVWICGGEPAEMVLFDRDFRRAKGMSCSYCRHHEEAYAWTYDSSIGSQSWAKDQNFKPKSISYNLGGSSLQPFLNP